MFPRGMDGVHQRRFESEAAILRQPNADNEGRR